MGGSSEGSDEPVKMCNLTTDLTAGTYNVVTQIKYQTEIEVS